MVLGSKPQKAATDYVSRWVWAQFWLDTGLLADRYKLTSSTAQKLSFSLPRRAISLLSFYLRKQAFSYIPKPTPTFRLLQSLLTFRALLDLNPQATPVYKFFFPQLCSHLLPFKPTTPHPNPGLSLCFSLPSEREPWQLRTPQMPLAILSTTLESSMAALYLH